jgi:hypothetical protein
MLTTSQRGGLAGDGQRPCPEFRGASPVQGRARAPADFAPAHPVTPAVNLDRRSGRGLRRRFRPSSVVQHEPVVSLNVGRARPIRKPTAATHPPFAATLTVRRGRQSRSTYRGNDLRIGSSHARTATRTVARAVVRSRNRRAPCDSLPGFPGPRGDREARFSVPGSGSFPVPVGQLNGAPRAPDCAGTRLNRRRPCQRRRASSVDVALHRGHLNS